MDRWTHDIEPFSVRGRRKSAIERDEGHGVGSLFGGDDRSRQLEGIGRAKRVHPEEARRDLSRPFDRLRLVPRERELVESAERICQVGGLKEGPRVPAEPVRTRTRPTWPTKPRRPGRAGTRLGSLRWMAPRRGGGGSPSYPEPHRPLATLLQQRLDAADALGQPRPRATERPTEWAGPPNPNDAGSLQSKQSPWVVAADVTGSRRATGRPRSVMTTLSPARTRSSNELRPFFAWVIVVVRIWLF